MAIRYIMLCALMLLLACASAQTNPYTPAGKEEVLPLPHEEGVSKAKAQQNADYWENQVLENNQSKNALFNLVIANRQLGAANFYLHNNAEVLDITDSLTAVAPGSFEAEFAQYLIHYPTNTAFEALNNAASVAPTNMQLTGPLMEKALVEGNVGEARSKAQELISGNQLDQGLVAIANDVSTALPKNAIIFCEGEMDCYPLYAQQAATGQPDQSTLIVDRQLLNNSNYRQAIWQHTMGIGKPPLHANATIQGICERSGKTSYLTLSIDRALVNSMQGALYVVGNVFQYSSTPIKNIPILEKNWNEMSGQQTNSALNGNYLVPAIVLKNHYTETGQAKKAKAMEKEVAEIAERNGKKQQLINAGVIGN